MLYVTHVRTVQIGSTRFGRTALRHITARISTRPYDHHAPKRRFTEAAWARLMATPGVMYRVGTARYMTPGVRFTSKPV